MTNQAVSPVSYAEIASKGPKQSPEEAAAPAPPEITPSESAASTVSLIDVDTPSVHTVPADFKEQPVKTETEADRIEHEAQAEQAELEAQAEQAAADAKKTADKTADKAKAKLNKKGKEAAAKAKATDKWLTHQFAILEEDHPLATKAAVVVNLAAVVGVGAFLGVRAWGLHERGQLLTWQTAATGAAVVGAVGVVEGTLSNYFFKAQEE